ncbi:Putative Leucine rich repeat domain-containing protein [Penicillium digitatum]|nr:Putative Leucine rich repeat domain-containing protein [Penicillium digitatum]
MDLIPPSYRSATDRDAWIIIARYIPSSDLYAASLVCHRWHGLFMPFLWGDPASHFGTNNDVVYVALTRFRRTLKYARQEARALTHTLHLPSALSELYGDPRSGWLRDILECLPSLRRLMVSKLPFFDHNAMRALKTHDKPRQYNIRLLLAESEPNTTSAGFAQTLLLFPALTYLDLSYTTPARDRNVLSTLAQMPFLRVLKLRGIGLKDNDAEFLANAIGQRESFLPLNGREKQRSSRLPIDSLDPFSHFAANESSSDFFKRPDLEDQFMRLLAQPVLFHPWVEDLPHAGITHLYISGNQISMAAVVSLLLSSRLHALDFGTIRSSDKARQTHCYGKENNSGAEKLVPILDKIAGENLIYFRAHHAVLTGQPPDKDAVSNDEFHPELSDQENFREVEQSELDAFQQVYELPEKIGSLLELADTAMTASTSACSTVKKLKTSQQELTAYEDEPAPSARRGPASAPEAVQPVSVHNSANGCATFGTSRADTWGIEQAEGGTLPSTSIYSDYDTLAIDFSLQSTLQCTSPISLDDFLTQAVQELLAKRPGNQSIPLHGGKENRFPYLHPSCIPHMETLVLTDVPSHVTPNSSILSALTRFITDCSNEALLATLQAGSDYTLPPGQARMQAEQQWSRSLFGLRRLVLEITPVDTSKLTSWKPGNQHNATGHSSTGDRDSENLWSAAADDFSFFGEEECGVPENDTSKYFPTTGLNEKVSHMPSEDDSLHSPDSPQVGCHLPQIDINPGSSGTAGHRKQRSQVPTIDLVAELAAFRRGKRAEYEQVVRRERGRRSTLSTNAFGLLMPSSPHISLSHYVEGHWKGEVKVVRNPPKVRAGTLDLNGDHV